MPYIPRNLFMFLLICTSQEFAFAGTHKIFNLYDYKRKILYLDHQNSVLSYIIKSGL